MNRLFWIVSIAVMVAVCTYLFNYFYEHERNRQIDVVISHQEIHARQAARGFSTLFAKWNGVLSYLTNDREIVRMDRSGREALDRLSGILKNEIRSITRTDRNGTIVFASPAMAGLKGRDISGQKHMRQILRTHEPVVSDVFQAVQGYQAIAIHYPVFRKGEYDGSLAFVLNFERIVRENLDDIRIGRTGHAWMLSGDGVELYCPTASHIGHAFRDSVGRGSDLLALGEAMLAGSEGSGLFSSPAVTRNVHEGGVIATYLPIRIGNTFWSLAVTYSEDEITASIATFRNKLIGVLVLTLLVGVSLSHVGMKTWVILRERQARERVEQQLLESESRYRLLFEENPAPMLIYEKTTHRILAVNSSFLRNYGYSQQEALTMHLADLHPPEEHERLRAVVGQFKGYHDSGEWHHHKRDGTIITIEARSDDLTYQGQNARVAVLTDITDRKLAEESVRRSLKEKEVLLKEVHHRVKNNLQVITSMLSMQAAAMPEGVARSALMESQARVRSIALVHERLYVTPDFSRVNLLEFGRGLAERLAHTWYSPGVALSVGGEDVEVGVDVAVPFAQILNELLTNALKHAFVGRDTGTIEISIRRCDTGTVELAVRDDGIGFPGEHELYHMVSTGMTLIVGLLEQISGTISLERNNGTGFVVRFPG